MGCCAALAWVTAFGVWLVAVVPFGAFAVSRSVASVVSRGVASVAYFSSVRGAAYAVRGAACVVASICGSSIGSAAAVYAVRFGLG